MDTSDLYKPGVAGALFPVYLTGIALMAVGFVIQNAFGDDIPAWRHAIAYVVTFSGPLYMLFVLVSVLSDWDHALSSRAIKRVRKVLEKPKK